MNIEKSFRFPFDDQQWISKLGLGALITLVPILNFSWNGYLVEIIRNVMDDRLEPLPNWDDLGKKFTDGLILFAAALVYAAPILLLMGIPMSMLIFSGILSGSRNLEDVAQTLAGAGGALFLGLSCVFVLYGLLLSVIYPAILVIFAREGTFASCFKLREVFGLIGKNASSFFTAWGISLVAGLAVGFIVGMVTALVGWIPCIGWIIVPVLSIGSGVYTSSVYAHLFGQFGIMAFGQTRLIGENPPLQAPSS
jgi:hypothetical protein